ncbi:MAG: hypothetical protein PUC41_09610 [Oscillospiraceae bacterium]|nr:hypothetical protein [Oscillospiraceae bacterium]
MFADVYQCRIGILLPVCLALLILLSTCCAELAAILCQQLAYCMQYLIPSLYAGMLICQWMVSAGGLHLLQRMMSRFGVNGALLGVYLLSQIAGYPIGALLLCKMRSDGQITGTEAKQYATVCFGAGPSFPVGLAGAQLLHSPIAGWLLFLCCLLANAVLAAVMLRKAWCTPTEYIEAPQQSVVSTLVTSAQHTLESLWQITATVLLFGVVCFVCDAVGVTYLLQRLGGCFGVSPVITKALLYTLCDITNLPKLCSAGIPYHILLPLLAACCSFGGICVHCQCLTLGEGCVSLGRLLLTRAVAALLAALICSLLLPFFPPPASMDVFANQPVVSKTGSLLPALLIFCTGFPLFSKKDWTN